MKTALTARLNYLHTRLRADFGGSDDQTIWLEAGGGTWTKISVFQAPERPAQKGLAGVLTMATGSVQFFIRKSDWPGVNISDSYFRLGPPAVGNANVPHVDNPKYKVTACPASPQLDWQRIEAERH